MKSVTAMHSRPWRALLAMIAALALGTAPIVAPDTAHAAGDGDDKTLKVALTDDIDTLNPFTAILASSTGILRYQYDTLVDNSPKDNSETAGLASKWKTKKGGQQWVFTIPKDRKWSDGKRLTAGDAAYTFKAIKKNDELKQANGSLLDNVKSVKAASPTKLVMQMKKPQAPNPGEELPIVPKHVWKKKDKPAKFKNKKNTVGSGPFIIKKYTKSSGVRLKANPHFWRGKPKIDEISYSPYKSKDAAVSALQSGEVDFVSGLEPAQYKALKKKKDITVNAGKGRRYTSVAINPGAKDSKGKPLGDGDPILHDRKVRKALIMAIDSEKLLKKVVSGLGERATGEIPSYYPKYHWDTDPDKLPLAHDAKKAGKLLDRAGYPKKDDGKRHGKDGKPITLRLMGRSSDPTHKEMANYIKSWMKKLGITIKPKMQSSSQVNDDSVLGKYDLYFTGWGIGPDPDYQMSINRCSSRPNADGSGATSESNWCSSEFDKLYKKQHVELDKDKRADMIVQQQKLIYKAAVNDVLYYANELEAYRSDRFEGFTKEPAKDGVISGQNGYSGFYHAKPAQSASDSGSGSTATVVWIVVGAVVVLLIIGGVAVARRRVATRDERE